MTEKDSNKIGGDVRPIHYRVVKKVGSGAFGEVFKAESTRHTGKIVALKCEDTGDDTNSKDDTKKERLYQEYLFYRDLNNNVTYTGIPKVYWYGRTVLSIPSTRDHTSVQKVLRNVMIMEYLGPSLDKLFFYSKYCFSMKTILMIGIQCIERLEFIHNNGIIHRDIKPENFLIGASNDTKNTIYLVDFGLSKRYIDLVNYRFNQFKNTRSFAGTYRFCSLRSHKRLEQGRRDDLESLGYVMIYFMKRELPWQGVKDNGDVGDYTKSNVIFKMKRDISVEELCKDCPAFICLYIKYCRLLRYTEVPNYEYMKNLLRDELALQGHTEDNDFDWAKI